MTYKELIYIVSDIIKLGSDDAQYTEEHIAFLLNRYRASILKQYYSKKNKAIPQQNYQTLCIDVEPYKESDSSCSSIHLRSKVAIPTPMTMTDLKVTTINSLDSTLSYVSTEQYQYVNANPWTKNIIYATKHYDNYLYLKSSNPQFINLKKVKVSGIFEDPSEAAKYACDSSGNTVQCDWMETEFPIEDGLSSILIETVVKILQPSVYMPSDTTNNAKDDLSNNLAPSSKNASYAPKTQYVIPNRRQTTQQQVADNETIED